MKKIKTSEAIGPVLDWLVAKCLGADVSDPEWALTDDERFTTDWAQGGPIIEREKITVRHIGRSIEGELWDAAYDEGEEAEGPTPLVAAMRCFVASRLGETVEVPEELL